MNRASKPFLRKSDGQYCGDLADGTRLPLGKNKKIAEKRWRAILDSKGVDLGNGYRFHDLLDAYESWAKVNLAETTWKSRKFAVKSLREFMPDMPAEEITPRLINDWVASTKAKSSTTKADRITLAISILNWGVDHKLIQSNPLSRMRKPQRLMREEFISVERFQELFDAAKHPELRDFLTVMLDTGCRAEEMFKFEARHFTGDSLLLERTVSKGRRKRRRVYLPPVALEIVQRLVEEYPEGKLFRNTQGKPYTSNAIRQQCARIKKVMGLDDLCATMLRHSFAHAKLTSGEDPVIVAKLLGHVDTRMICERYGHLDGSEYLAQKAQESPLLTQAG